MELFVKTNSKFAREPRRDFGVYLFYTPRKYVILKKRSTMIDTELSIKIPTGYHMFLNTPRELAIKEIIVCNFVDIYNYNSNSLHIMLYNISESDFILNPGDIIANATFYESPRFNIETGLFDKNDSLERNNPLCTWIYFKISNDKIGFISKYTSHMIEKINKFEQSEEYKNSKDPNLSLSLFILKNCDNKTREYILNSFNF